MKIKLFQHGDHGGTEITEKADLTKLLCALRVSVLKAVDFLIGRGWLEARWSN